MSVKEFMMFFTEVWISDYKNNTKGYRKSM